MCRSNLRHLLTLQSLFSVKFCNLERMFSSFIITQFQVNFPIDSLGVHFKETPSNHKQNYGARIFYYKVEFSTAYKQVMRILLVIYKNATHSVEKKLNDGSRIITYLCICTFYVCNRNNPH